MRGALCALVWRFGLIVGKMFFNRYEKHIFQDVLFIDFFSDYERGMSKDYENNVWLNLCHHLPTIYKIYFKTVLIQWSNYRHIISVTAEIYGSCDGDDVMVDYELLNLCLLQ